MGMVERFTPELVGNDNGEKNQNKGAGRCLERGLKR
jgi:hypothetical protein